jgi:UDP-glucose 4-epimerase
MRYLVFGAGGFLGRNTVSHLQKEGEEVVAVHRKEGNDYVADISSYETFGALNEVGKIDVILNCASVLPDASKETGEEPFLESLFRTNVVGAANILRFAAEKGIKRVINCSTLAVINKPWPAPLDENYCSLPTGKHVGYASSKLAQELVMNELAREFGIDLLHLRLSALYGSGMKWEGVLPMLVDKFLQKQHIALTNASKVSFDFLFIEDLVRIIHLLSKKTWEYSVVNVASGEEVHLDELCKKIGAILKQETEIQNSDTDLAASRSVIGIGRLKNMAGDFKMTTLTEGLSKMIHKQLNKS